MKTMLSLTAGALLGLPSLFFATTAQAEVMVYGEASSTGETINVQVFADITVTPILSFSLKIFYQPEILQVLEAMRNDDVWYFFDGANTVPYAAPDTSVLGEVLFVGGRMDSRDPLQGVVGNHVLLGTVVFARLTEDVPEFGVEIGRDGEYASFVTSAGSVLDALPDEVAFGKVLPDEQDKDLDGLGDPWEEKFFGDIGASFYSDDDDQDGLNNLGEEAAGTDPTNPQSSIRLVVSVNGNELLIEWGSVKGRSYALEVSKDLKEFAPLKNGLAATPPMNSLVLDIPAEAAARFYQILLETP